MQCFSCSFENMPGSQACARCGSALNLDSVSVQPPRASRFRTVTRLVRIGHAAWRMIPRFSLRTLRLDLLLPEPVSWRALAWSFIPGLGHIKTNRLNLGWFILIVWGILLLSALLSVGTAWLVLFQTGMIAAHVVALVSLFAGNLAYERLFLRALFGLVLFLGLRWFLYQPAGWFCARFYAPLAVQTGLLGGFIENGDGLLLQGPWLNPSTLARGDLVAYRVVPFQRGNVYIAAGVGIDRIVGVPGDLVTVRGGELLVNGRPPPPDERPLGPLPPFDYFDREASSDHYVIFPTRLQFRMPWNAERGQNLGEAVLRPLCEVSSDAILGKLVFRLRPWSRFGPIE